MSLQNIDDHLIWFCFNPSLNEYLFHAGIHQVQNEPIIFQTEENIILMVVYFIFLSLIYSFVMQIC